MTFLEVFLSGPRDFRAHSGSARDFWRLPRDSLACTVKYSKNEVKQGHLRSKEVILGQKWPF